MEGGPNTQFPRVAMPLVCGEPHQGPGDTYFQLNYLLVRSTTWDLICIILEIKHTTSEHHLLKYITKDTVFLSTADTWKDILIHTELRIKERRNFCEAI